MLQEFRNDPFREKDEEDYKTVKNVHIFGFLITCIILNSFYISQKSLYLSVLQLSCR